VMPPPPPTPSADRVAIAKAAIDALPFDHKIVLFTHWFTTLPLAQKNKVLEAMLHRPDDVAFLIDKLHDA
jgi:hypothetical protein